MLTLLLWALLNGLLFHYDFKTVSDEIKILMTVMFVISDLHWITDAFRSEGKRK